MKGSASLDALVVGVQRGFLEWKGGLPGIYLRFWESG
jgi:hypothetical protein